MFDTVSVPAGATAGVLLIHGGTGRGDHERERGERLAELGYAVHAPDLFGGPATREAIVALAGDPTELRRRVVAAWHVLSQRPCRSTFAVGHCFGGLAALELARAGADVRAVVSLHGGLATSAPATAIRARILAVCGGADAFCPPAQRAAFEAEMTAAGAELAAARARWRAARVQRYPASRDRRARMTRSRIDDRGARCSRCSRIRWPRDRISARRSARRHRAREDR